MKKTSGILRRFGFSRLAEQIYIELLNRGACSVSELAQVLKQHRPVIYKLIPELLNVKLITKEQRGKRTVYKAASPQVLAAWIKKQMADVEHHIPILTELYERRQSGTLISSFEGKNGLQTALDDVVKSVPRRGRLLRIEAPKDYQAIKPYYTPYYRERANGRSGDIDKLQISNTDGHERRRAALNRESKPMPGRFAHNFVQFIGDDRVMFMDYDREQAFVIKSKRFAAFQKDLFKQLFESL